MKKLFFMLTFLIFLSFAARGNECDNLKFAPQASIKYSYGNLTYDTSKTSDEITVMAKKYNQMESSVFAEGLSTADISFVVTIKTSAIPVSFGKFCVVPDKLDILLAIKNPTIYISNSLVENSCKYHVVKRHEQTHQQINKTTIEYYLPIFKAAAISIINKTQPHLINETSQLEPVTIQMTQDYNSKMNPLLDYIKKEIFTQQQRLDNTDNYRYEYMLCKN